MPPQGLAPCSRGQTHVNMCAGLCGPHVLVPPRPRTEGSSGRVWQDLGSCDDGVVWLRSAVLRLVPDSVHKRELQAWLLPVSEEELVGWCFLPRFCSPGGWSETSP